MRGVGSEKDYWFVYVTCLGCDTQGIGMAVTSLAAPRDASASHAAPALSSDNVPNAHELVAEYRGDVHGLLAPRIGERVR